MKNAVGWFEIYVDDMARAKAFYEAIFQQTLTRLDEPDIEKVYPQPEMWAFPLPTQAQAGACGAICKMDGVRAGGNSTLVYFNCSDCEAITKRVPEAGGSVIMPKMSIGDKGFIGIARDTEGNTIGLHSMQ